MRPLAAPNDVEMGLIFVARHETDIKIHAAQARRQLHTLGALSGVAVLVFAYDALSIVLGR